MNLIEVFLLRQRDFPEQFQGKNLICFALSSFNLILSIEWQQVQTYLTAEWILGKSFLRYPFEVLSKCELTLIHVFSSLTTYRTSKCISYLVRKRFIILLIGVNHISNMFLPARIGMPVSKSYSPQHLTNLNHLAESHTNYARYRLTLYFYLRTYIWYW